MRQMIVRVIGLTAFAVPAFGQVAMETVLVGNPGNLAEASGQFAFVCGAGVGEGEGRDCGRVDYAFEIGKFEVTARQYVAFLNAVAATDTYALYNPAMSGTVFGTGVVRNGAPGSYVYTVGPEWADRPIGFIAWADALRFANWMHNGQPTGPQGPATTEDGSYTLNGATTNPQLQTIQRNPNATWVIPSEDEWYKAAYHKANGPSGSYADFATQTDDGGYLFCVKPSKLLVEPDPGNSATWGTILAGDWTLGPPFWKTEVGAFESSPSAYGTFDQAGNIAEWTDSRLSPVTNPSRRVMRGGSFYQFEGGAHMHAAMRFSEFTAGQLGYYGFRMARVEPDCNGNGVADTQDLISGTSVDTNYNDLPDECDVSSGRSQDCNANGVPDEAEVGLVRPTEYAWDDGRRDDPIGFGLFAEGNIGWLNHFTVRPGRAVIGAISLSYGYTTAGLPVTVCLWADPNGDGVPSDASPLAVVQTAVANPDSDVMNVVDIPDIDLGAVGTSFFVGALMAVTADDAPVNLDFSGANSGAHTQSWMVTNFDSENPLNPADLATGNFLARTAQVVDPVHVAVRAIPVPLIAGVDADQNGIPDDCAPACVGDFNGDGGVDGDDVIAFFAAWDAGFSAADVNEDGGVDGDDVITFFARWDSGC